MPAIFPGSVRVFTTKVDLVDTVMASHVNLLQDEVTSVQTTLGTSLLSSTWAGVYSNTTSHINLSTRLINIEAGVKAANTTLAAISGPVVGTTDSQTLTNKILTNPTINAATITGAFASTATITGGTVNPTSLQQGGIDAVTVSGTQTLTSKTLTNPTINAATISGAFTSTATIAGGTVNPTTLQQGGIAAVVISGAQTLTGKTLTAPVISTIVNTGTLTLPTTTDTLVGRATTDTLTGKTLTSPVVNTPTINGATISGTVTSTATVTGGTVNPTTLQQGSVAAVIVSGAQTLTGKTLTAPVISTIVNTGTLTLPTSTDTLVGRATTDTLTGKTISGASNTLSNIAQSSVTSLTTDLASVNTGLASKFPLNVSTIAPVASYELLLTDAQKIVEMNYTPVPVAVSTVAINIATSVVTVTTSAVHGLVAGERAFISNLTNSNSMFNGSWAVTGAPSTTTFTFVHTSGTLANRAVSNVALTSNVATLTTSAAHGFAVGNTVVVSGVTNSTNIFNGTYTVVSVPSTTTFTYAKTNANIASAAATGTPLVYASSAAATGTSPTVYEENLLTIPNNNVVAFPVGTSIFVVQTGPSQTTIVGAAGVTVNSFIGLKIIGQWAGCTLIKRAENTWVAVGGLVA